MKTKDRDPESYFAIVDSFLKKADLREEEYNLLSKELKRYLALKFEKGNYVHPIITKFCTDWYREFYRLINNKDPYKKLKDLSNKEALNILSALSADSFEEAVNVSLKGNQLDFGAVLILNPDLNSLKKEFDDLTNVQLTINDREELKEAITKAQTILFLPDNAGEIIFDIPLLKYINSIIPKSRIFIAGKESPMLNDVTIDELKELEIQEYGTIISTGSNCFGLHEEEVSLDFKKILKEADLVLAKGQAYLEFFTEYNFNNVFNIARVKYPIINNALGTLGSHQNVIISSKRYAHTGKAYNFEGVNPKIISRSKLRELAEKLKKEGKKIVTANGSYDVLHIGHIKTLEEAKKQGDVLIVGLNSDSSIKQYKSEFRPINNEEHRAEFIAGLESVDYVFIFDETVPMPFLEEICPDVHCNGIEYGENCIEAETVKKYGGRIHLTKRYFSTTELIQKIMEVYFKEKKQTENKETGCVLKEALLKALKERNGILFAEPAIVYRETYCGRDIIAKNSKFEVGYTDERNYLPVEWWIMSLTEAENNIKKENEGLTKIKIGSLSMFLKDAANLAEFELFGDYKNSWPLTKILDIGGKAIKTSFLTEEIPPIPAHVHSGIARENKIYPPGKLEAYFFPPVDIPPYNQNFGTVITRLGIKPDVTKKELVEALKEFGRTDAVYALCNEFQIKAYDGWIIPPAVVHAPGPSITFEIQRPQDDFNLLGWQLGQRFKGGELGKKRNELQLRGLKDEEDLIEQAIDWEKSTNLNFKSNHYRPSKVLEQGFWGRRLQIFFDEFYGEAIELEPGQVFVRNADNRPFTGIVWSGKGVINGNLLDASRKEQKEFFVSPNTEVKIKNEERQKLIIFTVFPIKDLI